MISPTINRLSDSKMCLDTETNLMYNCPSVRKIVIIVITSINFGSTFTIKL